MIRKKGIAMKTFVFTSLLITFVVMVSFGVLYLILPDYYFYTKQNSLKTSTDLLVKNLNQAASVNECSNLISVFSQENNATVMSYDDRNAMIADLSSPFIFFSSSEKAKVKIQINEIADYSGVTLSENPFYDSVDTKIITSTVSEPEYFIRMASESQSFVVSNITLTKSVENGIISRVAIGSTLQPIDEAKNVMVSLIPFLLTIDIIIALIAAYFFSKQLTKPILSISEAAASMQMMVPNVASDIQSNDELGELSQNLDSMYRSLWANMEDLQYEIKMVNKLEQSKTDFMRAASHELKTPIAALNGITEGMIDQVGVYKNKEKYLEESKKLIDRLTNLVNEILSASALEDMHDTILLVPVDVSKVLEQVLEEYQLLIEEKGLQILIEKFSFVYETDEKILRNTLSNLISNAVKYTKANGKMNISFLTEGNTATLSIENQCEAIAESDLSKLFEPFYTLNYSRDRSQSGTGLGLYIVKRNLQRLHLAYLMENTEIGLKFSLYFGTRNISG